MTEQKPYLGRCKSCDYAVFVAQEDLQKTEDLREVLPGDTAYKVGRTVLARCPNNHRVFSLKRIEGTYSEDFKCDSRCLNAKSHKCRCSCGGMNHGRGHAVKPIRLALLQSPIDVVIPTGGPTFPVGTHQIDNNTVIHAEPSQQPDRPFMGEIGEEIQGIAKVTWVKDITDATIYLFRASEDQQEWPWTLKWFAPSYANPGFAVGDEIRFKAKVKSHQDDEKYGRATLVTYLEEI